MNVSFHVRCPGKAVVRKQIFAPCRAAIIYRIVFMS